MRRSKFLELVSAYIDGEISQSEEEQLREEIRRRPELAIVLASYERMNGAARSARFPRPAVAPARNNSRIGTFFWCLSGVAVCAAAAMAIVAAVGGAGDKTSIPPQQEFCVLSGDFAVKAEVAAACPVNRCAANELPRDPFLVQPAAIRIAPEARAFQPARFRDYSIKPICQQSVPETEVINYGKFRATLPQGMGAICIPTTYEQ
jgi:hypothetical protein